MASFNYATDGCGIKSVGGRYLVISEMGGHVLGTYYTLADAEKHRDQIAASQQTVDLVVRHGKKYGDARPGDHVRIGRGELALKNVREALCEIDEFLAAETAIRAKEAAKNAPPKKGRLVAAFEAGMALIARNADVASGKIPTPAPMPEPPPVALVDGVPESLRD